MASVPPPGRFSNSFHPSFYPVYRHPLTKCVDVFYQGGPGAPGLKGDGGDSGPQVRTLDQPASISLSDLRAALFIYTYVCFKGTQRSSGPKWSARESRKEGNRFFFSSFFFFFHLQDVCRIFTLLVLFQCSAVLQEVVEIPTL